MIKGFGSGSIPLTMDPDPGGQKTYGSDGEKWFQVHHMYVQYLEVSLGHLRGVAVSALLLLHHKLVLTKNQKCTVRDFRQNGQTCRNFMTKIKQKGRRAKIDCNDSKQCKM